MHDAHYRLPGRTGALAAAVAVAGPVALAAVALPAAHAETSGPVTSETRTLSVDNEVVNPGFESSTTGWKVSSGALLDRSSSGHSGAFSGRVRNSTTAARTIALNDVVNTVSPTVAGRSKTASVWLRTSGTAASVGIRLMEYRGSTLLGQQQSSVALRAGGWHQVNVTYVPVSNDASLDLNVLAWQLPAGAAVEVDDVRLADTTQPAPEPGPTPAPTGWRVAWNDEFDDTTVDRTRWNVRDQTGNSNEQSYLLARNVTEGGGALTIRAKKEAVGGRQYSSGYLDTIGKTTLGIGTRWEVRAKVPTQVGTSQGLWPAFWLRSNETAGEIDVAEWYGSPSPNLADSFRKVDNIVHESTNGGMAKSGKSYTFPGAALPSDGFHTYAVELLRDGIHFYVDGVPSHTVLLSSNPWIAPMMAGTWNIRLNFQVGKDGSWATAPTAATAFPADFAVDYVRVYQQ